MDMQKPMGKWGVLGILGKFLFLLLLCATNTIAMGQPTQTAAQTTKIYESSARPFPPTLDDFNVIGHMAGGSGGVTILQDSRGQKFTLKCSTDATPLKEEIMADALYRAMGVPVPGFAVYNRLPPNINTCQGHPLVRVSRFIEFNPNATDDMKARALAQNFVADAFMSNWDIVIGEFKNILMDKGGDLWRIDNGGSLRYRALGGAKKGVPGWDSHRLVELDSMRDPQKSFEGAAVYGSLTPEDLRSQAQRVLSRSPQILQTFETVSRAINIENPEELREMLTGRLHDLANRFGLQLQPGRPAQDRTSWPPVDTSQSLEKVPLGFNAAGQMVGRRSLKDVPGSEEAVPFSQKQQEQQLAQTIARKSQLAAEFANTVSKAKKMFAPTDRTYSESQKALAKLPYTASDAYLTLMMGADYDLHKSNPAELINLFFDKPYTALFHIAPFENPNFRKILTDVLREERKHAGWYVFYHGTDAKLAFMNDILSTYRARFQATHAKSSPKLRFIDRPFIGLENVDEFKEFFSNPQRAGSLKSTIYNYERDFNNPNFKEGTLGPKSYQDMGLSVNVALFASDGDTGSSSIDFFAKGTTTQPPDYEALFNMVRKEIGFNKTWADFQPLFEEYQRNHGRLYQIFIHPDSIDEIAYLSHGAGPSFFLDMGDGTESDKISKTVPILRNTPTDFLKKVDVLNTVQARLFLKPELFNDPSIVNVKIYNNNPPSREQEKAFWTKLNALVNEDVGQWIMKKEKMTPETMHGGMQPIEKLTAEVYRGQTGLPYTAKDPWTGKKKEFLTFFKDSKPEKVIPFLDQNKNFPINDLIEYVDYYNPKNNFSIHPLFGAFYAFKIYPERERLLVSLIERGADATTVHDNQTILDLAIQNKMDGLINYILDHTNVDLKHKDKLGDTYLHAAIKAENLPLVKKLVGKGINVNEVNNEDQTALNLAISKKLFDTIGYLARLPNIDLSLIDKDKNTYLHLSAKNFIDVDLTKALLGPGVPFETENKEGKTPLQIAAEDGTLGFIYAVLTGRAQTDQAQKGPIIPQTIQGISSIIFNLEQFPLQVIHDSFLEIPNVANSIRSVQFVGGTIQDILAICSKLPHLESLVIEDNNIGDAGAIAIAKSQNLGHLTELILLDTEIGPDGAMALVNSSNMANLTHLNLGINNIGPDGASAIANSPHMARLTALNLRGNNIGDGGAAALAQSTHMANITHLNLGFNRIGPDGTKAIANSLHMVQLTDLNLEYNDIAPEGVMDIITSRNMAKLTGLNLEGTKIGDEEVIALADSSNIPNLTHLNLGINNIGPAGAKAIAASPRMSKLTHLSLRSNNIGLDGAKAIANSSNLSQLIFLNLESNKIGAGGADVFTDSPHMSHLTSLNLMDNWIFDSQRLKARFPFVKT